MPKSRGVTYLINIVCSLRIIWVIAMLAGIDAAENALSYFSPEGEQESFVSNGISAIKNFI